MPVSFQEWLRSKTEDPLHGERVRRLQEWREAYQRLTDQITRWLIEAGEGRIQVHPFPIERSEQGLGTYELDALKIRVGDSAVEVVPVGRNVVGHVGPAGLVGPRAAGRVDITDGVRKFALYRSSGDGEWYVVDERAQVTPFDSNRLQEILMDIMT